LLALLFCGPAFSADKPVYDAVYGDGGREITVATGSPGALGLLRALAEPFCRDNSCRINWVKKGSGAALALMKAGECDLVLVHAPEAERKAVREGWAARRTLLGSNEFYVVGPGDDPAGIREAATAPEAYAKIAGAEQKFFSRGDNSGTHKKEMKIWKMAGIEPAGGWYVVTRAFMGPTLRRADRENGYFMTDSSTYLAKKSLLKNIAPLFRGDPLLVNVYHALIPSPEKYPRRRQELAVRFIDFVASPAGQNIIRQYGKAGLGTPLYHDIGSTRERIDLQPGEAKTRADPGSAGKPLRVAVEFVDHAASAHIAREKGWYEEAGLEIKPFDNYLTGMALAAALSRGDIDAAYICLIPAITAYANGGVGIKAVCGTHRYGYGLLVNPEKVKTVADLLRPDVRVACSREGSPTDAVMNKAIELYRLDGRKLKKKVRRMTSPAALLLLEAGRIDAAFLCEQYPTLGERRGFKELLNARDLWPGMQGSVLVVKDKLLRENPEEVRRLVEATEKGIEFINRHPGQASRIVARALTVAGGKVFPLSAGRIAGRLEIRPEDIKRSLAVKMINTPKLGLNSIQEEIDYLFKLGYIKKRFKAEEIVDLSFIN